MSYVQFYSGGHFSERAAAPRQSGKANHVNISLIYTKLFDEPVERICEANVTGENSSFIFTVCAKSVALYHFKLAYVVLHMAVKELFETHFQKWRNRPS